MTTSSNERSSSSTVTGAPAAVEFDGVTKYFASSDVLANNCVSFEVAQGSVHAVIGENGAGKSTLMNLLYGVHQPDSGQIVLQGLQRQLRSPRDAIDVGIGMVHQHFRLVPSFTVAENIVLGTETSMRLSPQVEVERVGRFCEELGLPLDPSAVIENLPVGIQQRVEIAKLLWRKAEVLILDEPTAVLTPDEADELFVIIQSLAKEGRTVLFITHKLREVEQLCDRVTVMRSGQVVGTHETSDVTQAGLAEMMVGRSVDLASEPAHSANRRSSRPAAAKTTKLWVSDHRGISVVKDVSLSVGAGEIVGLAGVSGNGQSELVAAIAGLTPVESGTICLSGQDITHASVEERRQIGLAHIAEDRLEFGVSPEDVVRDNLLPGIGEKAYARFGRLRPKQSIEAAQDLIDRYQIAGAHPLGQVRNLSGGNMQKIVIARELEQEPTFLIASQPTRGVDVGSIEYIHDLLRQAAAANIGILLMSVELDEILALSDRVAVMFDGQLVADDVIPGDGARRKIGALMGGAE